MPTKAEAYIYQAAQPSIRSMGHMHLAKSYGANIVLSLLVQICCCASTDSFFAEPVDLFIQERSRTCYKNEAALAARTKPHLQERSCTCKNEAVKTSSQVHSCCICKCINAKANADQAQTKPQAQRSAQNLDEVQKSSAAGYKIQLERSTKQHNTTKDETGSHLLQE